MRVMTVIMRMAETGVEVRRPYRAATSLEAKPKAVRRARIWARKRSLMRCQMPVGRRRR